MSNHYQSCTVKLIVKLIVNFYYKPISKLIVLFIVKAISKLIVTLIVRLFYYPVTQRNWKGNY